VPAPRRIWKAFAPAANAFTVSTLSSIGFAKLKQVFKAMEKFARRIHNAGVGFAGGFHLTDSWTAISSSELPGLSFP